jgi:hypothetical protein
MAKAEWASWVQAVGSVLAIVFAIWLFKQQTVEARNFEDEKRALDGFYKNELMVRLFHAGRELCDDVMSTTEAPFASEIVEQLSRRAQELREEFREAPIFEIAGTGIAHLALRARGALSQLKTDLDSFVTESSLGDWAPEQARELRKLAHHTSVSTFVSGESLCLTEIDQFWKKRSGKAIH